MFISPHIAVTRVWVVTIISGVPLGVQTAILLCTKSGCPFDITRVVPVVHCAVTQGPLATVGGGSVQPATIYGAESVTVGMPETTTRALGTVGVA